MKNIRSALPAAVMVAAFAGSMGVTASLAMWSDDESIEYSITAPSDSTTISFNGQTKTDLNKQYEYLGIKLWSSEDRESMQTLAEKHSLFRVLRVDATGYGENGLSSAQMVTSVPQQRLNSYPILKYADQYFFKVDRPESCSADNPVFDDPRMFKDNFVNYSMKEVTENNTKNTNNKTTTLYLCHAAILRDKLGPFGKHENTATVTGTSSVSGSSVQNEDTWKANATQYAPDWTEYVDEQLAALEGDEYYENSISVQTYFTDTGDAK